MKNSGLKWKRFKFFDGKECGIRLCKNPADGYACGTRPVKEGRETLWFGPVCSKCLRKKHPSWKPMTIAEMAYQYKSASALANVLAVEVGEVLRRLAEAGVDEQGQALEGGPQVAPPAPEVAPPAPEAAPPVPQAAPPVPQAAPPAPEAAPPVQQAAPPAPEPEIVPEPPPGALIVRTVPIAVPVKDLAAMLARVNGVLEQLKQFEVVDQASMDQAAAWLAQVKGKWREFEKHRKEIVKPWRKSIETVQGEYNPLLGALVKAETILKGKIAEGRRRAEETERLAAEQAQRALRAGDVHSMQAAAHAAAASDVNFPKGVSQRMKVCFKVENPSLVPQDFWIWVIDESRIQAAIDVGHRQIPGVAIWEEPVIYSASAS